MAKNTRKTVQVTPPALSGQRSLRPKNEERKWVPAGLQPDMGAAARLAAGVLSDPSDNGNENPKLVQVRINGIIVLAQQYVRSPVKCDRMAKKEMPKGYESIAPEPYDRIVIFFQDNSCPVHLYVLNSNAANDERQYCFTSNDMKDAKVSRTGVMSISPDNIVKMVITPGEKLTILGLDGKSLQSKGLIASIICITNSEKALNTKLVRDDSIIET